MTDSDIRIFVSLGDIERKIHEKKAEIRRHEKALQLLKDRVQHLIITRQVLSDWDAGKFDGKSTHEAIQIVLGEENNLTTREITDRMLSGGFQTTARNPIDMVRTALHRMAEKHQLRQENNRWVLIDDERHIREPASESLAE